VSLSLDRPPAAEAPVGATPAAFATVARRSGAVFAVQVAGAGLTYGLQVLLARLLGASGYGIYAAAIVWVGFGALLAGLGLPAAALRFLPEYAAAGDSARTRGFLRAATRGTLASAAAMALLLVAAIFVLHRRGSISDPADAVLAAVTVVPFAASILYSELARAAGRVVLAYAPTMIVRPALIALGSTAVWIATGALSAPATLAASLAAGVAAAGGQWLACRRLYAAGISDGPALSELRTWAGVGISLLAAGAFTIVLMQVDVVIVGAVMGARAAGVYSAAAKTAMLALFAIMAVNGAAAPQYSALWARRDRAGLQRLVRRMAHLTLWPSVAITAGLALLAGPLLALFGPGFQAGRAALLILLAGQLVNASCGSVGYLLTLTGHHREATWALGASAVACVLLVLAGTEAWGIDGAALGTAVGSALWNLSLYLLVIRRLGFHPSLLSPRRRHDATDLA
jgi:O-antigen/teichoic acid export membrane protein